MLRTILSFIILFNLLMKRNCVGFKLPYVIAKCLFFANSLIMGQLHYILLSFALFCCWSAALSSLPMSYQFPEQWQLWKTEHGKNYSSQLEDLDRHVVWLSNKKYIESHNSFSHVFGYTLALNQFADMVSKQSNTVHNRAHIEELY